MGHPLAHAQSSKRKWGGEVEDYLPIHNWFDIPSKAHLADFRHRALRHHSEGIAEAEECFGVFKTNSAGRRVPVRLLGEQHVKEDLGRIPTLADWLRCIRPEPWMSPSGHSEKVVLDLNLASGEVTRRAKATKERVL